MAKKEICDQAGIKLQSIYFNEAQKGKDKCDRDGAVAKRKIRTYGNEGHNVTDAVSVKEAIDAPPKEQQILCNRTRLQQHGAGKGKNQRYQSLPLLRV